VRRGPPGAFGNPQRAQTRPTCVSLAGVWLQAVVTTMAPQGGVSRPSSTNLTAAADWTGGNEMQDLILSCNRDGMENLRKGEVQAAFEQFKYAEAILLANSKDSQENISLLAVTCNNLGCYYKKVGKFHGALSYLRRALKMEVELNTDESTLAGTHLNLGAIFSKLEKPEKAVQHALSALELMHKRISQADGVVSTDDYATLAVAYHNIAMEREFMQQWDQAATAFQTGYQIAKRFLGEEHPLAITLEKNCDAVLAKAKMGKVKPSVGRASGRDPMAENAGVLPSISRSRGADLQVPDSTMGVRSSVQKEAADWANSEEALWATFAHNTLRGDSRTAQVELAPLDGDDQSSGARSPLEEQPLTQPSTLRALALRDMQELNLPVPKAFDMGSFRFQAKPDDQRLKKTPLAQALEDHPNALMDIIDAEGEGHKNMRYTPNDFRPNRVITRSTRTSRVVRRTGVFNSFAHRDRVGIELERKRTGATAPWKSAQTQTLAATRIQRVWRAWFQYCQENSEWMTVTWICATMIQSHWRSYHVRRKKMDKHAGQIQRHCRGFLVRRVLHKHTAAVTIQRRVIGMLTRQKLQVLHNAAKNIQRLVRGGLARKSWRSFKSYKVGVAIVIQKHVRVWLAKRYTNKLRAERHYRQTKWTACVDLQRMFRGWKGRQRAEAYRQEWIKVRMEHEAATRIQSAVRARVASRIVDQKRKIRLDQMERAATFLRKVWLGVRTRKKYLSVLAEFEAAQEQVVILQRYTRGFICRLKLWREAVAAEEELWAAMEIQRRWRGYCGRVRWEHHYEEVWRREMSAAFLQQHVRGWLARVRVGRMKRRLARDEFERARRRYRSAQKIQARMRGCVARKAVGARHAKVVKAAADIQRVARGHMLRRRLWQQVIHQRATTIQAITRGFLVRNRRFQFIAKVILIQREYRRWLVNDKHLRQAGVEGMKTRRRKAALVQKAFRQYLESRDIRLIQDPVLEDRFRERVAAARQARNERRNVRRPDAPGDAVED